KKARPSGTVLLLDNHPVPGGEAKQNVIDVDGVRLIGPQGSNDTLIPGPEFGPAHEYWNELNIPKSYEFVRPAASVRSIRFARDNYEPMFWYERSASTGWFFGDACVVDAFRDDLARAPIGERIKRDWLAWHNARSPVVPPAGADPDRWLDSMSYGDYVVNIMKLSHDVFALIDPLVAAGDYGVSATAISAYAAKLIGMPGPAGAAGIGYDESSIFSFPGGNTATARYFFKALIPDAIAGGTSFADIVGGPYDFAAFDRPGTNVRARVSATAVSVRHQGPPEAASHVNVVYFRDGSLERITAKAVVMAGGGWVNRHVVRDLPPSFVDAYAQFHHAPILVVNVGLRNWRAMARLGVSALRWFEGIGFFANIRQPMQYEGYQTPLDPEKPAMLTLYMGFPQAGVPLETQASAGRQMLFATSYAAFESQVREQLQKLLGASGFDQQRDIGAIVLNRWGHAYIAPQPGFYFGTNGKPAPAGVIRQGYGRIAFGHSELTGRQNWPHAVAEGKRAATQTLATIASG
ncbi:MAG: NAD(P)/FAD-dependent oxidoreductase, partial [Candidatus Eremiobacteraeota bacterium]|nr:NAD(P)/FAD-dependent oxidoreductase [Candidatus Eremiobacteraeota bacterium]